ncbi:MAG: aminopeptidase [Lachnospiraceae bacterium]|jgi:aspartyl aminopeptidase|nr:aminopeptidase [Lachnospiraceae bacterium]MDE7000072.1 aminopeptidase [Lachnospiraceae bacterium]
MKKNNLWLKYSQEDRKRADEVCERYKRCLDQGKTERECVALVVTMAEDSGYRELYSVIERGETIKAGDKLYAVQMDKSVALFQIGRKSMSEGLNILGAHIDSPRIDIKQNPLYEKDGFAYFDTHYYGGIKKYQWTAIPMAIHGVIAKKDGTVVKVSIGEKDDDPVFVITDLLVHLAGEQMTKKAADVVTGDNLDLLIGNRPIEQRDELEKEEKEALRANIIRILADTYEIEEQDLLSAELEIVPAGKAKDLGFDRSMILGYGQDDRVCAFSSVFAMLDMAEEITDTTLCCLLVDKEEIGSVGATGMASRFFENTVAELVAAIEKDSPLLVRRALANSKMLSSDVSAGYDPLYESAFEKNNTAFLARGLAFNKYTGSRGKGGANDANAEYIAQIRRIMDDADVMYQFSELGKVDVGGGGTIAHFMAEYGMNVIDSGVPVLNMHAPYEAVSKADVYEAVRGYTAFLRA